MKSTATRLCLIACFASFASAIFRKNTLLPPKRYVAASEKTNRAYFKQYIDHDNPSLGTFEQYYIWSDEHYAGPGSPVILTTPGEEALDKTYNYLVTDIAIFGAFAKAVGGAVVALEHRYYGRSSPFQNLTTKNLQHLTLKNAIADLTHFANTAKLPFDPKGTSRASNSPWVLGGGSYPGALAAWTESTANGTFWAYHASSAPVQAIDDFWEYWVPEEKHMPQNCYDTASSVISHIDRVLEEGSEAEVRALKKMFMLQDLKHPGDFAAALTISVYGWQNSSSAVRPFCQYLEGDHHKRETSEKGSNEVEKGLKAWSLWFKTRILPDYCKDLSPHFKGKYNVECFNTFDPNSVLYTDTAVNNPVLRAWVWMLCNEPYAWWQTGGTHEGRRSIVSKFVSADYYQRQCALLFPEEDGYTVGSVQGKTVHDFNQYTQGWKTRPSTRLMYVNGQVDPWREAGVSSQFRPGGPLNSTAQVPVFVVPNGDHCPDYFLGFNKAQKAVVAAEVKQMKKWVSEYPRSYGDVAARG